MRNNILIFNLIALFFIGNTAQAENYSFEGARSLDIIKSVLAKKDPSGRKYCFIDLSEAKKSPTKPLLDQIVIDEINENRIMVKSYYQNNVAGVDITNSIASDDLFIKYNQICKKLGLKNSDEQLTTTNGANAPSSNNIIGPINNPNASNTTSNGSGLTSGLGAIAGVAPAAVQLATNTQINKDTTQKNSTSCSISGSCPATATPPPAQIQLTDPTTDSSGVTTQTLKMPDGTTKITNWDDAGNKVTQTYDENGKRISKDIDLAEGVEKLPPELKDKVSRKLKDEEKVVTEKTAEAEKIKPEDVQLETLEANINNIKGALSAECPFILDPSTKANCDAAKAKAQPAVELILSEIQEAKITQLNCNGSSKKANFLCPIATSPMVQVASLLMSGLSTVIPQMSSAKETCSTTSKANLIGQGLITTAVTACSVFKFACEAKCSKIIKKLNTQIKVNLEGLEALALEGQFVNTGATIKSALAEVTSLTGQDGTTLATCKGYAVDMGQMTLTLGSMTLAAKQAKDCEEKLASMEGTNNTAQITSMAEMCAQPQNAASSICKCRTDNTAPGCPGYLASSVNEGNINKDLNTKGSSNMAGLSYKSGIKPTNGSGLDANLGGLSDEASKALAAGADPKQEASSMFGTASGANSGGGGSTAGGATAGRADNSKISQEPKSFGSSFMNAVGSLFKGGSGKSATTKEDKLASDKYKEQIKRQIAAEQMRSEISSASGIDNWTKIKSRYKNNASSLIDSN